MQIIKTLVDTFSVVKIEKVGVSLGGAVELADLLDAEPVLELSPNRPVEAVAEHESHLMFTVDFVAWLSEQVASGFSDILSHLIYAHENL